MFELLISSYSKLSVCVQRQHGVGMMSIWTQKPGGLGVDLTKLLHFCVPQFPHL